MYRRRDTGGLLLRERQPRRFFGFLVYPQQRSPGSGPDAI